MEFHLKTKERDYNNTIPNHLTHSFTFKPAAEANRDLIHQWISQDYIAEWVHGQGLQNLLNGLEKFFQYQSLGKGLERDSRITQHWIGFIDNKPFVYLLTSNVFEGDIYATYKKTNGLAITLDIFIGDPNYVGRKLADQVIKKFLIKKFSDISEIFIDPEKNNKRAIHVYQKVGFEIVGEFIAPWHPVPHYIMRLDMKSLLEKNNHCGQ